MKNEKSKTILKTTLIIIILVLILGIFYFQFSLSVSPDGTGYYHYTRILDKELPFKSWPITRGFSFPVVLFVFKHLFGDNSTGMLIGFFLVHLILSGIGAIILNDLLKTYRDLKNNFLYWALYVLLIMYNPLIIGYSHQLLTEAIAPAIIMLMVYFTYKWKDIGGGGFF